MEINQRTPLTTQVPEKTTASASAGKLSSRKRRPFSYRWMQVVLFCMIVFVLIFVGYVLSRFVPDNPTIDLQMLEVKKCPACAGQSMCPWFFRGDVSISGLYGSRLTHVLSSLPAMGIQATVGKYGAARKVYLRRLGAPASPEVVDKAVCRRGPQHGLEHASKNARARLRCIPHLSVYRWRPTNDPIEGSEGEPVDLLLHKEVVIAPLFSPGESPNNTAQLEKAWEKRVMPTAFAPATRCATDRMFSHLQSRFRDRTSFGAPTRWLRFDELMFLFHLAIDPQAIIAQGFSRAEGWPFPTYHGACGRWIAQDYHGVPIDRFCGSPIWLRLRILASILELPSRLERPTFTQSADGTLDPTAGYAIYLNNFDLPTMLAVDPASYNVTLVNFKHAIIVDTNMLKKYGAADAHTSDYNVPTAATDLVIQRMSIHKCLGDPQSSGDAGGTTPPCIKHTHADELCSHTRSDHNYWAICVTLLFGASASESPCKGLLYDTPSDLSATLYECAYSSGLGARREAVNRAQKIVADQMQSHPIPLGW
ncbi:unnamed protein product [Calicophoron daubneyi]|uniref:Deleted in autism protein 1 n=1 Tax=Calicophoron daubneyi TaxID=300641 RepID=A0AAV2SZV6_CALDB